MAAPDLPAQRRKMLGGVSRAMRQIIGELEAADRGDGTAMIASARLPDTSLHLRRRSHKRCRRRHDRSPFGMLAVLP
jgi:hypothetical protein